jgi:capsular polysaccharide transport system ATP-binding protein
LIAFEGVWKFNRRKEGTVPLLAGISAIFPRGSNPALLCHREKDVDLIAALLAGSELPDRGRVIRHGRISWPMAELPGSRGYLTVLENLRFIARIYGVDAKLLVEYVDEFANLGRSLNDPMQQLDKTRKQVLSYAAALAIPFDWYVVTNDVRVREDRFLKLVEMGIEHRLSSHSNAIIITDDVRYAMKYGTTGVVVKDGAFSIFETVEEAADTFLKDLDE